MSREVGTPFTRALPCLARGPGYALPHLARRPLLGAPERRGLCRGGAGMRAEGLGGDLREEAWVMMEFPALVSAVFELGEEEPGGFQARARA